MSNDPELHPERLDEVADDYLARRRAGESPSIEDYAARHPELAPQIRELFPTLTLIEESAGAAPETPPTFPGLELLDQSAAAIGGMGAVYRAREVALDRVVAVKTTRAHLDTEEGRAFFESEARAAANLDHPNIVRVFSFHPDHEPPYYVMPFVEGRPLHEASRGKDVRFKAGLLEKVARAVDFAHGAGVVHRDIKPQNILVDPEGQPHITDFGLAKRTDALVLGPAEDDTTALAGTPHYIAPELFDGAAPGPATDIWSLGVTMYFVLTGRHPFAGNSIEDLRAAVRDQDPRMPVEIDPEIPEPLQRICLVACERDPAQRYDSAQMMADDLQRFLAGREVFARPTRYLRERGGKLANHLTDIALWRRQNLIDIREMDRLARPYRRMAEADSAWDELSRKYPWETALLRLGGWLAVVSSVLWLAFYWDQLVRGQRIAVLAVPCALVNVAGWMYHRRKSPLNAVVFLSTGSLLLPMLVAVLLAEYGWLRNPQSKIYELFGELATKADAANFVLTNVQANVVAGAFLAYALILLLTTRAKLFAIWVGAGIYLAYTALLLIVGLKVWLDYEMVSQTLIHYLAPCLLFVLIAGALRRAGHRAWAGLFYAFMPIPLVLILTYLARYGGIEWLDCPDWGDKPVQLWLMLNGAVYLALALGHAKSDTGYARFWGELFMVLVPVSLLVPTNVLFEDPPFLLEAGGQGISVFAYGAVLISIALVVFGTRMRRGALVAPGVIGLAIAVLRVTDRHFEETLAWPLTLALLGGVAMVAGALLTWLRGRATKPQ